MFADSDNMDWLIRGIVVLALMGGLAAVAHEVGFQVGVNKSSVVQSESNVSKLNPIPYSGTTSLPKSALLPPEEVSAGSGTTYKTVAPSAPAVVKKKTHKKRHVKKTAPYQKPYNELTESELASLRAAYR